MKSIVAVIGGVLIVGLADQALAIHANLQTAHLAGGRGVVGAGLGSLVTQQARIVDARLQLRVHDDLLITPMAGAMFYDAGSSTQTGWAVGAIASHALFRRSAAMPVNMGPIAALRWATAKAASFADVEAGWNISYPIRLTGERLLMTPYASLMLDLSYMAREHIGTKDTLRPEFNFRGGTQLQVTPALGLFAELIVGSGGMTEGLSVGAGAMAHF